VRNTIPWSIRCEILEENTRENGLELFSISLEKDDETIESISKLRLIAIGIISTFTVGVCCGAAIAV